MVPEESFGVYYRSGSWKENSRCTGVRGSSSSIPSRVIFLGYAKLIGA